MIVATVTGNIGKDAQMRQAGDSSVLGFSVASNSKERGAEITTWVECSLWGSRGEKLGQHLTRGAKVAVSGTLGTREYDGKTYLTMRVNELDFMGSARNQRQERREEPQAYPPVGYGGAGDIGETDDIGF